MDFYPLLAALAIVLLASFVQGATAFGFALVSVPLLLIFMPVTETVAISLVLGSILNLLMIRDQKREIAWGEIAGTLPAAAVGIIGGTLLLKSFNGPGFKVALALTFLAFALLMLASPQIKVGSGLPLRLLAGSLSGLLSGATSMGGPPMVLYLTGRRLAPAALKGSLALFFFLGNLFALTSFLAAGLIDSHIVRQSLILTTAIVPGYWGGRYFTSRLSASSFRRLVLTAMAVTALLELVLNLGVF